MSTSADTLVAGTGTQAGEPIQHDKPIALRLPASERTEVFTCAGEEGRSASSLALKCFREGWALHKQRLAVLRNAGL